MISSSDQPHQTVTTTELTERLALALRDLFLTSFKPGDRLPTMRQLCRQFDVSINTIRAALKDLQREGLIEMRQGRGMHRVRQPARICVGIVSESDLLSPEISPFWQRVAHAARACFRENQIATRCYIGHVQPREVLTEPTCTDFIEDVAAGRLHGVLTMGTDPQPQWMTWIEKRRLPFVSLQSAITAADNHRERLVREGLRLLGQAGCRRVALLAWGCDALIEPFTATAQAAAFDVRPGWIGGDLQPTLPGAGWEEFREIWTAHPEKPDGLLVSDEMLYRDAIRAITELGIPVPEQLRIVTHWTAGVEFPHPVPVTLLEHDAQALGRDLANRLWDQFHGGPVSPVTLRFQARPVVPVPRAAVEPRRTVGV